VPRETTLDQLRSMMRALAARPGGDPVARNLPMHFAFLQWRGPSLGSATDG
jgi:hypothetical protein